jgi:phosphatidylglycerophosphate synthase
VGQLALLAALWSGVGLGPVGWGAGIGCAAGVWALVTAALRGSSARLGPADAVTQVRTVLVGAVTALVADRISSGLGGAVAGWPLVALASVALLLDAVDGQVARRTGTASAFGARFDMEVDAFLILVLSVQVAGRFGVWVLAIGTMRYFFVAAAALAPWLRAGLPASLARKTVAALQGVILVVAASGVLPHLAAALALATALGLLCWSFGRDTRWLWDRRAAARMAEAMAAESWSGPQPSTRITSPGIWSARRCRISR